MANDHQVPSPSIVAFLPTEPGNPILPAPWKLNMSQATFYTRLHMTPREEVRAELPAFGYFLQVDEAATAEEFSLSRG